MELRIVAVGDNGLSVKGGKKRRFLLCNWLLVYALPWYELRLSVRKYTFKRTIVILS